MFFAIWHGMAIVLQNIYGNVHQNLKYSFFDQEVSQFLRNSIQLHKHMCNDVTCGTVYNSEKSKYWSTGYNYVTSILLILKNGRSIYIDM